MKKLPFETRVFLSAAILGFAAMATGCGNLNRLPPPLTVAKSSLRGFGSGTFEDPSANGGYTADKDYECPSAPNVVPSGDQNPDGPNRYSVCKSRNNTTDILIHSRTSTVAHRLCVYPFQFITGKDGREYRIPKPDQYGAPLSQCLAIESGGVHASFQGVNYNAVFLVDYTDKTAMDQCVRSGNYDSCPGTYGQF